MLKCRTQEVEVEIEKSRRIKLKQISAFMKNCLLSKPFRVLETYFTVYYILLIISEDIKIFFYWGKEKNWTSKENGCLFSSLRY